jgi:hypothetical protein
MVGCPVMAETGQFAVHPAQCGDGASDSLEQLITAGRQAGMKLQPEPRQPGQRLDISGMLPASCPSRPSS